VSQDGLRDSQVFSQVWPTRAETDQDASRTHDDFGGDFDELCSPSASEAFTEGILLASSIEVGFAV
jgi:hypothetical protein